MERFFVALRLVAHAQSGSNPAAPLIHIIPPSLPHFDSLPQSRTSSELLNDLPQFGLPEVALATVDPAKTAELSLAFLGSAEPFVSGPLTPRSSATGWSISPEQKQKYLALFEKLQTSGFVQGRVARQLLERSTLPPALLGLIWELSDIGKDGKLNERNILFTCPASYRPNQHRCCPSKS